MSPMHKKKTASVVTPLLIETYLNVVRESIGATMFRRSYARINGKRVDMLKNGELSCAFFVSFILAAFGLLKTLHATVRGTERDLLDSGWKRITRPKVGAVVVWEPQAQKSGVHPHIGVVIATNKAISHLDTKCMPVIHPLLFGAGSGKPKRKIEAIYWHPKLKG